MSRFRRQVSRIPLRRRLVAGFVATMFVLLTCAGVFVYWRVQYALDRNLDTDLERAATALAPHVSAAGTLPADEANLATIDGFQVLDASGNVLSHDGRLSTTPTLSPEDVQAAATAPVLRNTGELFLDSHQALRLYAVPVKTSGSGGTGSGVAPAVLVVALDREQHDEALRELVGQLTAAGLATLVLTAVVGDLLARAALRPVETYRRQAADIAAGAASLRLDVPSGRDDEIARLGHTLNDMLDALSRALDRERRFTNDASHELRTPLTRLTSRVQLTLRRPRTVAEHEKALAEIGEDLTRLTALADELLTLGTAASDTHGRAGTADETPPQRTDLSRVVRKVASVRSALAPSGSAYGAAGAVGVETSGPVLVDVDPLRLERIVDNLLDNAALHGAPPVVLAVDLVEPHGPMDDATGAWARLTVRDSGPGMPPDLLATATDRFARAPEARSRPGSGLGLALVATLVEAAGGEVRLCFDGEHQHSGRPAPVPVPCEHDDAMTVAVLLPAVRSSSTAASSK
jgi:two-component system, OmpR family, sensor kinase